MMTSQDKDRFQILLMKAVDLELNSEEENEFKYFVEAYPEYKNEWEDFSKLNTLTGGIQMKLPDQEKWDQYWSNIYIRLERKFGWILFSIGLIILISTLRISTQYTI